MSSRRTGVGEPPGSDAEKPAQAIAREPTFEDGLGRLEAIVRRLEGGDLQLEESLRLFEEGTRLTRDLNHTLEKAERTIEVLVRDASGAVRTEPFDPDSQG